MTPKNGRALRVGTLLAAISLSLSVIGSTSVTAATAKAKLTPANNFPTLKAPTGAVFTIGMTNTEGVPGLDFPEIRTFAQASVDYINKHGGMGGRKVKLVTCVAKGSPETSAACGQELIGKKVDVVLVGLDLFPPYDTYTAAGIPVIGVLPILPGDYKANALYLGGGNATSMAATAAAAKVHYKAKTVGIVSADNAGANGTAATLQASLDKAGIKYKTVKGGDNETDAGYQGLMREAAKDNPDLLISLYADAGCIGTIRGRAALGIKIPVITTIICAGRNVRSVVGDDALGWAFVAASTDKDTPEKAIMQNTLAKTLKTTPDKVDVGALGLGFLGVQGVMTMAEHANRMKAKGGKVTGPTLYSFIKAVRGTVVWPTGAPLECGSVPAYSSVCTFSFPVAAYTKGGENVTIPGLENVSVKDFLP
jgi:ABC-type branched-subunit amino acid transport system substrate-binding protein